MGFRGILFLLPIILVAQFSPGKLSKYHAHLEGNTNCVQCHELGKKEISNGCNECHTPLKIQIEAKQGFHKDKTNECSSCHSDHNGKEFELVYWPKNIENFDHEETGYSITGKHTDLTCAKCHTKENIKWKPIINWAKKNTQFPVLDRTFLGLESTCNSCHTNIHEDSISNDCSSCHNTLGWENASNDFDHNRAKFLLTGAHKNVDCASCHPVQQDHPLKALKLTGIQFDNCTRCHEDIHQGSYGNSCESCHTTVDWKKDLIVFDHSKTKYPLLGKHTDVGCIQCHKLNLAGGLPKYDTCLPCHEDKHFGQFDRRKDKGNCSACHNVDGFKPTTFTSAKHQKIRFILEGAHKAIPCSECHKPFEPVKGQSAVRFTWRKMNCNICHDDVHRNQFQKHYANACEDCHTSIAFAQVKFAHEKTLFPLDGKHKNVDCQKCHQSEQDRQGKFIRYQPVPHTCADCHTFTGDFR